MTTRKSAGLDSITPGRSASTSYIYSRCWNPLHGLSGPLHAGLLYVVDPDDPGRPTSSPTGTRTYQRVRESSLSINLDHARQPIFVLTYRTYLENETLELMVSWVK